MGKKDLLNDPLNIIICGIGGQGNILASELLGSVFVDLGYIVAVGETYGASQRGGSVMSHVRVSSNKQMSVLIPKGKAHVIVGFEPLETLRILREYGGRDTVVIYDPRVSYPLGVLSGEAAYPDIAELDREIRDRSRKVYVVEAADLALSAGNPKAANIALMGAITRIPEVPLDTQDYEHALTQRFSGEALRLNRIVFGLGYDAVESQLNGSDPSHIRSGKYSENNLQADEKTVEKSSLKAELLHCTFIHPYGEDALRCDLPSDMTLKEVMKYLYDTGFVPKKKADYKYIIGGHLCSLNETLSSYAYHGDSITVTVHALLTLLA